MNATLLNPTPNMPRTDYPRPQWVRENWYCLNGEWDFAFDFGKSGKARGMVENGEYTFKIQVPFCPESKLSGIEYTDFIPAVWYRRTLNLEGLQSKLAKNRTLLHFGAVDYQCEVWVNGKSCGTHKGGYSSFTFDITDALQDGENTLVVYAEDDLRSGKQPYGKQCEEYLSRACSYTRTTGIWQTVWLEFVPTKYLDYAKMIPAAADGRLSVEVHGKSTCTGDKVRLTAKYDGREVGQAIATFAGQLAKADLAVSEKHLWNPGAPKLYDLTIELLSCTSNDITEITDELADGSDVESTVTNGIETTNPHFQVVDTVASYFALRDVSLTDKALAINGKPVFMRTVLDQGFNPDGIYTAPNDEFLKRDIELSMDLGLTVPDCTYASLKKERFTGRTNWGIWFGANSLPAATLILAAATAFLT